MIKKVPNLVLIILLLSISPSVFAEVARKNQFHARFGLISGSYNGTFSGSFSVPYSFDFAYESFISNNRSWIFRFTQVMDLPDSRPFYTYAGIGSMFYTHGKGMYSNQQEADISVTSVPQLRYFYSLEFGIAQAVVQSFGSIVQAVSSMAEFGASWGAIYQINNNFGIQGNVGATLGYGFSSVAVLGHTGRALIGMTYYY